MAACPLSWRRLWRVKADCFNCKKPDNWRKADFVRQVQLIAENKIEITEVKTPKPGAGELLVKVGAALTCGSDLKTIRRGFHPVLAPVLPHPFGHEFAGSVVALGSGVDNFKVGERIVAANSAPCGICPYCLMGRESLCEDIVYLNGAFAEYIVVPARIVEKNTMRIADDLPFYQAAMTEPLACVLHGVDISEAEPGEAVAVIGQGPIGSLFTAHLTGRRARVIAVDIDETRLQRARRLGAVETVRAQPGESFAQAVRRLTPKGLGVDVAIEAVGTPEAWSDAIKTVRRGGKALMFGGVGRNQDVSIDPQRIHYDEVIILGVYHHTPIYIREALSLLEVGWLNVDEIITHHLPLSQIEQAFELMAQGTALKVALNPEE
jgi:L-iditol 2-dehydrogenase